MFRTCWKLCRGLSKLEIITNAFSRTRSALQLQKPWNGVETECLLLFDICQRTDFINRRRPTFEWNSGKHNVDKRKKKKKDCEEQQTACGAFPLPLHIFLLDSLDTSCLGILAAESSGHLCFCGGVLLVKWNSSCSLLVTRRLVANLASSARRCRHNTLPLRAVTPLRTCPVVSLLSPSVLPAFTLAFFPLFLFFLRALAVGFVVSCAPLFEIYRLACPYRRRCVRVRACVAIVTSFDTDVIRGDVMLCSYFGEVLGVHP